MSTVGLQRTTYNQELRLAHEWLQARRRRAVQLRVRFPITIPLPGRPERQLVVRVLRALVATHAGLRTLLVPNPRYAGLDLSVLMATFSRRNIVVPGTFVQWLLADLPSIQVNERSDISLAAAIDELSRESADARPLEGSKSPIVGATLWRSGHTEDVLIVLVSHLSVDFYSSLVISQDYRALYEAYRSGDTALLPEVVLQPHDYAAREWKRSRTEAWDCSRLYWHREWQSLVAGQIDRHSLPFLATLRTPQARAMVHAELTISAAARSAIAASAAACGASVEAWLRASVAVTCSTITGRPAMTVWTTCENREESDLQRSVLWCSDTHMYNVSAESTRGWRQLLKEVEGAVSEVRRHGYYPNALLVYELGYPIDAAHARINVDYWRAPSIDWSAPPVDVPYARRVDLNVDMIDDLDRIRIKVRITGATDRDVAAGVAARIGTVACAAFAGVDGTIREVLARTSAETT